MTERALEAFLDTPIVELCDYGLPTELVVPLETKFGLRVRSLERVVDAQIAELPNVGRGRLLRLKVALRRCLDERLKAAGL